MKMHTALARYETHETSKIVRYAWIDGLPGFVAMEADGLIHTTELAVKDGKIVGICIARNPDKLLRVDDRVRH